MCVHLDTLDFMAGKILVCFAGQGQPPAVPGALGGQEQLYKEPDTQICEGYATAYQCSHILFGPHHSSGRFAKEVLLSPFTEGDHK